tara:strand:+ start:67 stop:609 length:543 start_codon:yes stop_codon:yes gene_type:complete
MKKSKNTHYVDNEEFLSALIKYKKICYEAEQSGEDQPVIPEYIGKCFLEIANGLSFRPNFINYTYKDEMISDGIENCVQYCRNFDPDKSKNPFSYFTQIIYFAFLRRIEKEKKQSYVKQKITYQSGILNELATMEDDRGVQLNIPTADALSSIEEFEQKMEKKRQLRKRKHKNSLENFME